MQSSDEKDQRIKELENENRILQEKVKSLEHNVEILTQAVLHEILFASDASILIHFKNSNIFISKVR